MDLIEAETDRLRLRQWKEADYASFASINADPRVMQYFPAILTREESDAIAARCRALIEARGWGFWALELKQTGKFIGFVGLHIPAANLPFSPCVEIGWRIAYDQCGKGYATEAGREAIRIGFELLHFTEIVSFAVITNLRSRTVMERLGMKQQDLTFDHPNIPKEAFLESIVYISFLNKTGKHSAVIK